MDAAQRAIVDFEDISREIYASVYAGEHERIPSLHRQLEKAKQTALEEIKGISNEQVLRGYAG